MTLTQAPAELQKAVSGLTKTGDSSEPFKTGKGLVIIKVVELQQPKMLGFDAVKG